MNTSTLTAVMLAALLVTSGVAFAAPGGTADADARTNGSAAADAEEPERDDDDGAGTNHGATDGSSDDGGTDATGGERVGTSRLGVVVSAVAGSDASADGDVRVDGEVEAVGGGSSDDGRDTRERAADRVRSIHDRLEAFFSGALDGDIGVRIGLGADVGHR